MVAGLSALVVAPAPTYDPWTWLLWGREVAWLRAEHRRGSRVQAAAGRGVRGAVAARRGRAGGVGARRPRRGLLAVWLGVPAGRGLAGPSPGCAASASRFAAGSSATRRPGRETGWTIASRAGGAWRWRAGPARCGAGCGVGLRADARRGVAVPARRAASCCGGAGPRDAAVLLVAVRGGRAGAVVRAGVARLRRPAALGRARARVPARASPRRQAVPALAALREAAALPLWPLWSVRAARGRERACGRSCCAGRRGSRSSRSWRRPGSPASRATRCRAARASRSRARGGLVAARAAGGAARRGCARASSRWPSRRGAQASTRLATCGARRPTMGDLGADLQRVIERPAAATRCSPAGGRTSGTCAGRCWPITSTSRSSGSHSSPRPPGVVFRSRLRTDARVEPARPGFAPAARGRRAGRFGLGVPKMPAPMRRASIAHRRSPSPCSPCSAAVAIGADRDARRRRAAGPRQPSAGAATLRRRADRRRLQPADLGRRRARRPRRAVGARAARAG